MPPGFDDQFVTTVTRATALAFTPDGRMVAPAKDGTLHVVRPGAAPQVALDIRQKTCFDSERGVLGTAVDPLFSENHFVYLYYTFKKFGVCDSNTPTAPVNRVSRFVLPDTDVIDPATETVLIDNIPSPDGVHNAGDLGFGQDGYLYVSVGDGGCDFRGDSGCFLLNDASRDLAGLSGKLLRVTRDGASPPGNPFMTGPNAPAGSPAPPPRTSAAPRSMPAVSATRSGSHPTPAAAGSTSTTSARPSGRRSTAPRRGPTSAGTCARDRVCATRARTAAPRPRG